LAVLDTIALVLHPRAGWAEALLCSASGVRVDRDAWHVSPSADEVEHRRDAAPFSP
jgi:hypothetical protein